MEAILLPLVVMFFILVLTLGIEKASKAIIPLAIIEIFVYFFGNIICHLFRIGIYWENNFYIFGIYWRMYAFRSIF